jgi:hypothetical protein
MSTEASHGSDEPWSTWDIVQSASGGEARAYRLPTVSPTVGAEAGQVLPLFVIVLP